MSSVTFKLCNKELTKFLNFCDEKIISISLDQNGPLCEISNFDSFAKAKPNLGGFIAVIFENIL